jgi:CheY-like chemotaxis protein
MSKQKILIVEDEPHMRTYLSTLLETEGYEPIVAKDGEEGVKKARKVKPQLIILDVMLPKMGGIRAYRELKTNDKLQNTPVIMLSAIAKKTFFESRDMLKYNDGKTSTMWSCPWDPSLPEPEAYIEKPPEREHLLEVIQGVLK